MRRFPLGCLSKLPIIGADSMLLAGGLKAALAGFQQENGYGLEVGCAENYFSLSECIRLNREFFFVRRCIRFFNEMRKPIVKR